MKKRIERFEAWLLRDYNDHTVVVVVLAAVGFFAAWMSGR